MGLSKPIIITSSAVDTSNLVTKSDLTALQNTVANSVGAVAKVQVGTVAVKDTVDVTLSGFSNVNKMCVLLDGHCYWKNSGFGNTSYPGSPHVQSLTVSTLTISAPVIGDDPNTSNTSRVSYQVIEFK